MHENTWMSVTADCEPLLAIALAPEQLDQANRLSRPIADPQQQWQTYLNAIALGGFEQWLQSRGDFAIDRSRCTLLPVVSNLRINGFVICLIAVVSQPDAAIPVPRAVVTLPELAAQCYVLVEVYEEQGQTRISGFQRYDQLVQGLNAQSEVPLAAWDPQLDRLLLYLRCAQPASLPLPVATAQRPGLNVYQWLQNQLDEVAAQLAWSLLPSGVTAFRPSQAAVDRSAATELAAIVTQLARLGVQIPPGAKSATQTIVTAVPLQLYAIVGCDLGGYAPQEPAGAAADPAREQARGPANGQPPEWSLLVILGAAPGGTLPPGTTLSIRDATQVLVTQTLRPPMPDDYLFAQVVGTWDELFVITLGLPQGETIVLPPFAFRP